MRKVKNWQGDEIWLYGAHCDGPLLLGIEKTFVFM
jgi:hypothetical protein